MHKQHEQEWIRYPCDQCDYVATLQSSLNRHKKSKHEGIRYPCYQCEYAATTFGNLQKHKQSIHEGIRYPCDQCDYVATKQSNLKVHMKRKLAGQLCDKTIVKGKKVKVMIEKLDCSTYLKHLNSSTPDQIQIFDNEEAITNIKIEKSEDMISTIDHEYEYEAKDSKLNDNLVSDDCDLILKIESEEDFGLKTESPDLSEFIEHCRSEDISSSAEFIELSGIDVSDTEIKIEDSVDPLSTDEFDSDVMVKNEPQYEYEQCTTSNTSAVETEMKEENIEDPLPIFDEQKSNEIKTEHMKIKHDIL